MLYLNASTQLTTQDFIQINNRAKSAETNYEANCLSLSMTWFPLMCTLVDSPNPKRKKKCALNADFWQWSFFHLVFSECAGQSHNFTTLIFCDVTFLLSITDLHRFQPRAGKRSEKWPTRLEMSQIF